MSRTHFPLAMALVRLPYSFCCFCSFSTLYARVDVSFKLCIACIASVTKSMYKPELT